MEEEVPVQVHFLDGHLHQVSDPLPHLPVLVTILKHHSMLLNKLVTFKCIVTLQVTAKI